MLCCTPKGFIFLASLINYTLHITKPKDAKYCYITIDYGSSFNDSWPHNWSLMNVISNTVCAIDIPAAEEDMNIFIYYKIRYIYPNHSHCIINRENDWFISVNNIEKYHELESEKKLMLNGIVTVVGCVAAFILVIIFLYLYRCHHHRQRTKL